MYVDLQTKQHFRQIKKKKKLVSTAQFIAAATL